MQLIRRTIVTFTILGTAAAEGWPALWCPCDACAKARKLGGKDIRRRSAYQLDERIHIDFGPDSYAQMLEFGLSYHRLEHLLITHSHADHLFPTELQYRSRGFVPDGVGTELTIHGNAHVERRIRDEVDLAKCEARFVPVTLFEPIDLGEGVIATPLLADHAGDDEMAVNYLLEREGRALLQGNDSGWWPDETWEFLATKTLDIALIECTYGPRDARRHHLGVNQVVEVRDELLKLGTINSETRVIATHFSHNGGWLYAQLEDFLRPHGIEVAWDGMQLEL
ncbi:MAG: carbon-phosphorus lyase [candidate division WS1 bacterium]|jgi:phosphoribosyl 1,2-cyclic phosphate phosphodiesterase|nr:carbon-phosphorus lyase [candidate division WS1 bacterium]